MQLRYLIAIALPILLVFVLCFFWPNKSNSNYLSEADFILKECQPTLARQSCYSDALTLMTSKEGIEFSTKVLGLLQKNDPEARQCHGIAHLMSETAVLNNPSSWIDLFSKVGMTDCAGGFLHGIIQGRASYDKNFIVNSSSVKDICNKQSSFISGACAHGFGHVLLYQTSGDVNEASKVCADVGGLSSECYNGMFMEDAFRDMLFEHGIVDTHISPTSDEKRFKEVKDLCISFKENKTASYACWLNMGHVIADFYKHNEKENYIACNEAPRERDRQGCYFRSISSLVILPEFSDVNKTLTLCAPYLKNNNLSLYNDCSQYLAKTLIYHSTDFSNQTIKFCSVLGKEYKNDCFRSLIAMLVQKTKKEDRKQICNQLPVNYIKDCIDGNTLGVKLF